EAPAMVHKAGHYWLFYSGNYLGSTSYAIGYALCDTPLGPCAKASTSAPWYETGPDRAGPGEESFFTDTAGNTWMAYNAWPTIGAGYSQGFVRSPHVELVRFTPAAPPTVSPPAEAVAASPVRGYYVLLNDGEVDAEDGAPSFGSVPIPGGLARAIAVMPDGQGYAVLDAYGGVHTFGTARHLPVNPAIGWPGWDIARAIAITPSGSGYAVLDGEGGVHPAGDAPAWPFAATPASGDVARSLAITPTGQGYVVLYGNGSIRTTGDAPGLIPAAPWPGMDVAKAVVMSRSGKGFAVLDGIGDVQAYGDAPPPPAGEPTLADSEGTWLSLAIMPDGRYVVVRGDGFSSVWDRPAVSPGPGARR
ncbi:MAG TPA: family 43 glycosylhydrolase, partial [Acidimicrobiales bacterium]